MRRPIKIHKSVKGKVFIRGNKGNIFINSDLSLYKLQQKAINTYRRNRKRIKREPDTKKLFTTVNIGQPLFDSKKPPPSGTKDPLYMTAEEKAEQQAKAEAKFLPRWHKV